MLWGQRCRVDMAHSPAARSDAGVERGGGRRRHRCEVVAGLGGPRSRWHMVCHEALKVEGHLALLAHVDGLGILLAHFQRHFAVPVDLLAIPHLRVHHPV